MSGSARGVRVLLAAWLLALVGYFGPWIAHHSAALAWNAFDLFDLLRLLPHIETGALVVNLYALRLPLVGLALWLPLLLSAAPRGVGIVAGALGAGLALATLPPYPQIVGAWSAPGWRVPFWWGVAGLLGALVLGLWARELRGARPWVGLAWGALTGLPAGVTLARLLPALREVYAAPVQPGWGFWCAALGWLALMGGFWQQGLHTTRGGEAMERPQDVLTQLRTIKAQYEEMLLHKANVVSVGIGMRMREGLPVDGPGIVVSVTRKVPREELSPADRIPKRLDGAPVWVEAVGSLEAQEG